MAYLSLHLHTYPDPVIVQTFEFLLNKKSQSIFLMQTFAYQYLHVDSDTAHQQIKRTLLKLVVLDYHGKILTSY